MASLIARKLELTGALGTVSEIVDGKYTGKLAGAPLHGPAKAEAVRALAERESLDLLSALPTPTRRTTFRCCRWSASPSRSTRTPGCGGMRAPWAGTFTTTGRDARPRSIGVPSALVVGAAAGVAAGVVSDADAQALARRGRDAI